MRGGREGREGREEGRRSVAASARRGTKAAQAGWGGAGCGGGGWRVRWGGMGDRAGWGGYWGGKGGVGGGSTRPAPRRGRRPSPAAAAGRVSCADRRGRGAAAVDPWYARRFLVRAPLARFKRRALNGTQSRRPPGGWGGGPFFVKESLNCVKRRALNRTRGRGRGPRGPAFCPSLSLRLSIRPIIPGSAHLHI